MSGISASSPPPVDLGQLLLPDGAGAETLPSMGILSNVGALAAGATGTLQGTLIWLPAGFSFQTFNFLAGTTGSTGTTNQWAAISRYSDRVVLGKTPDLTNAATAADAWLPPYTLPSLLTITALDAYVVWLLYAAATPPTLRGVSGNANGYKQEKRRGMRADTGLTVPAGLGANTAVYTDATNLCYCKLT